MTKIERRSRGSVSRGSVSRGPGLRGQRLEGLIREELSSLLEVEINDPTLYGARITRVELSGDGSSARVWFHTAGADAAATQRTAAAFERAAGFLRSRLCDALPLKRIPELRFRHDPAVFSDALGRAEPGRDVDAADRPDASEDD